MVETANDKEVSELTLEEAKKQLSDLEAKVEKQGMWEEGERQKRKVLKDRVEELENLKWSVSHKSSEIFWENDADAAKNYLQQIKDKSWSDLNKEGQKWISAVQVVLKDKWYKPWKVDWNLGRRRSRTRAAVREFQRKEGLRQDWKPWTKTINALLGTKSIKTEKWAVTDMWDGIKMEKKDNWEVKITYDDWTVYEWTVDSNGKYKDGTYTKKGGNPHAIKNGEMV